jgi:hypothetical protein
MRNRSVFDSIDDYKLAVYLSIYRGGGLDPLQSNFRVISTNLANNRSTKLGTVNCSAHAQTVRPQGRTVRRLKVALNNKLPLGSIKQNKGGYTCYCVSLVQRSSIVTVVNLFSLAFLITVGARDK